jgi:hypothetical protein
MTRAAERAPFAWRGQATACAIGETSMRACIFHLLGGIATMRSPRRT